MISLQTNTNSLVAQQNLSVNSAFQSKTIQQLTSGYRINSSSDDAAGLSVANQFRSDVAELTQGVRNANDGLSQLQIADSGLSNIAQMLDRMKTLATQSASGTFTGSRTTLDNEYQKLVAEVTREAGNIGLNEGGNLNTAVTAYVGGPSGAGSLSVSVDLSGAANAVDAASLGLSTSSIVGGGSSFTNNNVSDLSDAHTAFNVGVSGAQTFDITYVGPANFITTAQISIQGTGNGVSGAAFVDAVNSELSKAGLTGMSAQIGANGDLQFSGGNILSIVAGTSGTAPTSLAVQSGATLLNSGNYRATSTLAPFTAGSGGGATTETMNLTVGAKNYPITLDSSAGGTTSASNAANLVASLNSQLKGSGVYATRVGNDVTLQSASAFSLAETNNTPGAGGAGTPGTGFLPAMSSGALSATLAFTPFTPGGNGGTATTEHLRLFIRSSPTVLTLTSANSGPTAADTITHAVDSINQQLSDAGIGDVTATDDGMGNIVLTATGSDWIQTFLLDNTPGVGVGGTPGAGSFFGTGVGPESVTPPTVSASTTGNALNAISTINAAMSALGRVQSVVGAGQNRLHYAVALAQSEITNFSGAESQIRDADVAAQAANLAKAQILQQSSIAAMSQANSASQAVLRLLQ